MTTRYNKGINTTVDDGATVVYQKVVRSGARDEAGNLPPEVWAEREIASTRNCFDIGEARSAELVLHTYAMMPTSGQGANLQALETEVSPTLTSTDLAKVTDRGLRIVGPDEEVVWAVRRLTPVECERLQGFPDNHTAERWDYKRGKVVAQSDSARGHQIGNAVAVPVITWIAKRMVAHQW